MIKLSNCYVHEEVNLNNIFNLQNMYTKENPTILSRFFQIGFSLLNTYVRLTKSVILKNLEHLWCLQSNKIEQFLYSLQLLHLINCVKGCMMYQCKAALVFCVLVPQFTARWTADTVVRQYSKILIILFLMYNNI